MGRWLCIGAVLFSAATGLADTPPLVPPEILAQIKDDNPNPLPRDPAPEEYGRPLPIPRDDRNQPTGAVYCPAEYDQAQGMFISWGSFNTILTQMTVGVTTADPAAIVYVVVPDAATQTSARNTLIAAGADISQVQFIIRYLDTVWIRDYGPRFIFEDGDRAIIDHTYNRPRPNDDAFPSYIGTLWGETVYALPLRHGGGNFHLFANGDAFMTRLILDENPGLTEQNVKDYYHSYQNLDLTIYDRFPSGFDSTGHIDMWMQGCGDHKVIIGQYTVDPERLITNAAAADMTARGYTVYRTPGWSSGGTHFTYTNAVVLNNLVFVPKYNNVTNDALALAVFQQAFPGHTFYQVDCTSIIGSAGAMHCIMMHVPAFQTDPVPVARLRAPNGGETWTSGSTHEIRWEAHDDALVTAVDLLLSIDDGATYPYPIATGLTNSGTYSWTIPAYASTQARVKVVAHDAATNAGFDVSDGTLTLTPYAAAVLYDFPMDTNPGWTTQGLWAFGTPTGQGGGGSGGPDPTAGHTGSNVYGYNLSGNYENNLAERFLTTTALDFSGQVGVKLAFWRWLGVEQALNDHAYVRASLDGSTWYPIWQNLREVADHAWVYQEFDLSRIADDQPIVYLRWVMGTTSASLQYCGWNIDDVQLWSIPARIPADLNCDRVVNPFDIDPFILALTDPAGYAAAYPDCFLLNADANDDGVVNPFDIDPFIGLLTGP